jgi:hypothetical protein
MSTVNVPAPSTHHASKEWKECCACVRACCTYLLLLAAHARAGKRTPAAGEAARRQRVARSSDWPSCRRRVRDRLHAAMALRQHARAPPAAARRWPARTRAAAANGAPPAAAPLTKPDLVQHLRSGCKPREKWRCAWRRCLFCAHTRTCPAPARRLRAARPLRACSSRASRQLARRSRRAQSTPCAAVFHAACRPSYTTGGSLAPPHATHRPPRHGRSIGTEHEKFGFRTSDKRPIDYSQVKHLLLGLVNR